MSIEKEIKICSYDVTQNGTHKISSIYKYFQQIAREDLDSFGLTYGKLLERGMVFVLARMKTVFYEPVFPDDKVILSSSHRKVKGVSFIRDYVIKRNGKTVAEGSSYWPLINFETRRLCRPNVLEGEFGEPKELCSFEIDDKFVFPENTQISNYTYKVVYTDIDENKHMNNTRYPDICMDAIGDIFENSYISSVRIDYLNEAKLGDELLLEFNPEPIDGKYFFTVKNITNGTKCFDAEMQIKERQRYE